MNATRGGFARLGLAALLLVAGQSFGRAVGGPHDKAPLRVAAAEPAIPQAWLQDRIGVADAETTNMVALQDGKRVPFGYQNAAWETLKGHMRPGDTLWRFASPADAWAHLAGRAGIALVRDGEAVEVLVTLMN